MAQRRRENIWNISSGSPQRICKAQRERWAAFAKKGPRRRLIYRGPRQAPVFAPKFINGGPRSGAAIRILRITAQAGRVKRRRSRAGALRGRSLRRLFGGANGFCRRGPCAAEQGWSSSDHPPAARHSAPPQERSAEGRLRSAEGRVRSAPRRRSFRLSSPPRCSERVRSARASRSRSHPRNPRLRSRAAPDEAPGRWRCPTLSAQGVRQIVPHGQR